MSCALEAGYINVPPAALWAVPNPISFSCFTWYQAIMRNRTMGSPTASDFSSAALTTLSLPAAFNGPPASAIPPPSASPITAKLTTVVAGDLSLSLKMDSHALCN